MLRFAPSPTGDMHIGNLRAAIFNYILAKQNKQRFLIRIEDTDIERNIKDKDKEILRTLTLFGLLWDDLVYQSNNFTHHRQFAEKLLREGKAFYCYCTKSFLDTKRQEAIAAKKAFRYDDSWAECERATNPYPVVRLRGSKTPIVYEDLIKGRLEFGTNELDSFVIMRHDNVPTYNFACACDDMMYDISMIVRGEDHTSNTPKQILVHKALAYNRPIQYAHLPIILNENGKKMSKRDSASSVEWLLEQGFLPAAISNYLIAMGNTTPSEIFTITEAIEWFSLSKLAKSPVKFDIARLRFLNRAHLARLDNHSLAYLLESNTQSIGALARIYLEEASTLNELRDKIMPILAPKNLIMLCKNDFLQECQMMFASLKPLIQNPPVTYEEFKSEAMRISGLKGKMFFKPLRILLTGASDGPDLSMLYPSLRENLTTIWRLQETL